MLMPVLKANDTVFRVGADFKAVSHIHDVELKRRLFYRVLIW
jgi:hypothetical protein